MPVPPQGDGRTSAQDADEVREADPAPAGSSVSRRGRDISAPRGDDGPDDEAGEEWVPA